MTRNQKIEFLKDISRGKKPMEDNCLLIFDKVDGEPDLIMENNKKILKKTDLDNYLKSKGNPFVINWAVNEH